MQVDRTKKRREAQFDGRDGREATVMCAMSGQIDDRLQAGHAGGLHPSHCGRAASHGAPTGYRATSGVLAGVLRPAVGRGQSQPQRPKSSGWRLLGRCADAAARARDMDTKHARDCRRIPVPPYKTATFPQSSPALDIGAIPVP
ncbi:hypothetical protein CHU98_g6221 [Xylaria longipes]|nr:hypothetical protein CHU98_g6221 [Xylaria longipes]